jgi:hypothetical protein
MDTVTENVNEPTPRRTKRRLIAIAALAGVAAVASFVTAETSSASSPSSNPVERYRTVVVDLKNGLGDNAYRAFESTYSTASYPFVAASYEQVPPLGPPEVWLYIDYGADPAQYRHLLTVLHDDRRVARTRVESYSLSSAGTGGCASGGGSATAGSVPSTTEAQPASGTTRPEIIADLRAGTSAPLASYVTGGPVASMPGIEGSSWNSAAPLRVFFDLSCDATTGQIGQALQTLEQYPFVQSVEVSIAGV